MKALAKTFVCLTVFIHIPWAADGLVNEHTLQCTSAAVWYFPTVPDVKDFHGFLWRVEEHLQILPSLHLHPSIQAGGGLQATHPLQPRLTALTLDPQPSRHLHQGTAGRQCGSVPGNQKTAHAIEPRIPGYTSQLLGL